MLLLEGNVLVPFHRAADIARLLRVDEAAFRKRLIRAYMPELDQQVRADGALTPAASGAEDDADLDESELDESSEPLSEILLYDISEQEPVTEHDALYLPTLRIQRLLIDRPKAFTAREAAEGLFLPLADVVETLRLLASAGLIRKPTSPDQPTAVWTVTARGKALAARARPEALERASAVAILNRFLTHVSRINRRADLAWRVASVSVIGELLTAVDEAVPFVEVNVKLVPRYLDPKRQLDVVLKALGRAWQENLEDDQEPQVQDLGPDALADETICAIGTAEIPIAIRFKVG
ncbi:MAG: hypothetical protein NVS9B15_02910 [Acidobacteriaceae bacterium]